MKKVDKLIEQAKAKVRENDIKSLTYEQIDAEIQKLQQEILKFTKEEQQKFIEELREENNVIALELCDEIIALIEEAELKEWRLCNEEARQVNKTS